jgi:cation:H+ antiporter
LVVEIALAIAVLIIGIVLMAYSSEKAVGRSVRIATALKVSPLVIGLILVSIGTDLPEIVNSITSSAIGHGDINVGDSLGSALTQMTLILGLLPFLAGDLRVKKREVLVIGACEVLALILTVSMAEKGYFTRINALFLMAIWIVLILLAKSVMEKKNEEKKWVMPSANGRPRQNLLDWIIAILGFVGVAIGSYAVVQSVIMLSASFNFAEYLVSFFIVAIGTSLPELVVTISALRRKEYALSIGNVIGSCLFDASFSVGIGLFFFPQAISGELATSTGLYAIFGSIFAILILALNGKVDKKSGALFILVYLLSYSLMTA